ncbi:glycosyltransferase family 39 protein [Candidatus Roizmanbacteria bacterium]|nr:glycosyltransferase family 39 protein [Candidatus Roizmanbacteria bacterium]
MKKYQIKLSSIIFLSIILIGFVLRFYNLDKNPPGLNWDEASIGYNAYAILKTGADEYGTRFPASIRSFDDYKPPLYVYLTIPSVALFGLNAFSVRFISALLGSFAVIVMYGLTKESLLFSKNDRVSGIWDKLPIDQIALLSAFFLAISPWHLQFSRAAYEGNIGLFFCILGTYLLLYAMRTGRGFVLSGIAYALTLYSYHSFRLIIPLFLVIISFIFYRPILKLSKRYALMAGIIVLAFIPVLVSLFSSAGTGSRLSMVTIFTGHDVLAPSIERIQYDQEHDYPFSEIFHNRRIVYGIAVLKGYLDHFDPQYLFISGDSGKHHHAVDMGMLYIVDVIFLIIGSVILTEKMTKRRLVLFALFFVAPIASAITTGTPHPVRAIAMVPVFHILTAVGVVFVRRLSWLLMVCISVLYMGNIAYYLHQYYVHTPVVYADFWQSENEKLYTYLHSVEEEYDTLYVTYAYDQPYIYYLFFNKIDPQWYQNFWRTDGQYVSDRFYKKVGKYEFRKMDGTIDLSGNKLLVTAAHEVPEGAHIINTIYFPDGTAAYVISTSIPQ